MVGEIKEAYTHDLNENPAGVVESPARVNGGELIFEFLPRCADGIHKT